MTVALDIPDEFSTELGESFQDLGRTALEALAATAYDRGVLSLEQVRRLLRLPFRWEAESLLSDHGVWPGTSVEEFRRDLEALSGTLLDS